MHKEDLAYRIRAVALAVLLAIGCALYVNGCAGIGKPMSPEQIAQVQAGAEYLDATVARLQTALNEAKAGADPAKLAAAEDALAKAKAAAEAFKSSMSATQAQDKWAWARSLVSTAISVAGPILLGALVK